MQIFWVSGSVGRIRTLNLSFSNLVFGVFLVGCLLLLVGASLQYAGFRMAVEYNPQLARQLGNVHTAVEIENLKRFYQTRLLEVQSELEINSRKITDLELANQKLLAIATPQAFPRLALLQRVLAGHIYQKIILYREAQACLIPLLIFMGN